MSSRIVAGKDVAYVQLEKISPEIREEQEKTPELEQAEEFDVEAFEREVFERAYAEGRKEGKLLAEKQVEALTRRFSASLEQVKELRSEIFEASRKDLLALSVAIAEKVIRRQIQVEPETVERLVQAALDQIDPQDHCQVFLHPSDLELIEEKRPELTSKEVGAQIELIAKHDLQRGDCIIRSEIGDIHGRISEQLREIENDLLSDR